MRDYAKKQNWNAPLEGRSSAAAKRPPSREQGNSSRVQRPSVPQEEVRRVSPERIEKAPRPLVSQDKPSPRSAPVLRWVILGVLVVVILGLVWKASEPWRHARALKEEALQAAKAHTQTSMGGTSALPNTLPPPPPQVKAIPVAPPQYDFYKILPSKTSADRPVLNISGPVSQTGYLIQVGVFPNQDQANAVKAKLLMFGYSPSVVTIPGGAFSVTLGPIVSQNGASMIVRKLRSEGFQQITVKYLD